MGLRSNKFSQNVFLHMGLVVIAALFVVSISGSLASAYIVPQTSGVEADNDERIEILRRSGVNGEGMEDALKYLEELDKYYAQVARPRYVKISILTFSIFLTKTI